MRRAVVAIAAMVLALVAAAPATADIKALDGNSGDLVTKWDSAKCKVKKGEFLAVAKAPGNWFLDINLTAGFSGFGNAPYPLIYGQKDPNFFVSGPGGLFSNQFSPPGVEGQPGGFVNFSANGKMMSIGFSPAANEDLSAGLSIGGGVKCKYPKKRHH
jgi:hypothetical protein